jgi:CRISPR-associated protein Csy1
MYNPCQVGRRNASHASFSLEKQATMSDLNARARRIRAAIQKCMVDRLSRKLGDDAAENGGKQEKVEARDQVENWLAAAAKLAGGIQLATHIVKAIHPQAQGTCLRVLPERRAGAGLLGTCGIGAVVPNDVAVRNAAALYVYNDLLAVEFEEQPLWKLAAEEDEDFLSALSDDPTRARELQQAFAAFSQEPGELSSHTLAKQVYFPLQDEGYHLLAPLFPASLVHAAHRIMSENRFGETAKCAREARKKGEWFSCGIREYPELAVRKFGGSKPQNISQLNSERHGDNWLLASLPPEWKSKSVRAPWNSESVFPVWFGRQRSVKDLTEQLRGFLETVDRNNLAIRRHRASLVQRIRDELHQYCARLEELPEGWSSDDRCRLHGAERLWLDPGRANLDDEFARERKLGKWIDEVSHRFANWLNATLSRNGLPLGEDEHLQWKAELAEELTLFSA